MSVMDEVRIPESWEFWTGMDNFTAAADQPPAPQPDPVQWLNDRMRFWTPAS